MTVTFVDAGVLIAAARGNAEASGRAISILDQPERTFVSSAFVRLEVTPKAVFNKKKEEARFYSEYFSAVSHWTDDHANTVKHAQGLAEQFGLAAMDALHLAAALSVGAEEFITTERPGAPMHRVTGIRVVSIHPAATR